MSTFVMGLCWPLQMPPTAKGVLMSLADQSNDQGSCWPSLQWIAHQAGCDVVVCHVISAELAAARSRVGELERGSGRQLA